jgi:hypothetical protein
LELICGNSFTAEKADQVISAGWALDPVHPTKHIYAKAALNLIEKIAAGNKQPSAAAQPGSRKRTWSTTNRSDQAGGTLQILVWSLSNIRIHVEYTKQFLGSKYLIMRSKYFQ